MAPPPDEPPRALQALTELSGTVLEGRYELGSVLGTGGMGAVFKARHLRLDRPVAIKVLRPVFAGHEEYVKRFLREAKAASKIRHRNVVEILDYGETTGGLVYSVMEFLVGQDLEQLLRAEPDERLPWARACGLLVQVASGLKAAHGQGVIHRDIKPANCFLTDEDGEPVIKLVDFGIAKVEGGEQTDQLTATAQVLGTPGYIAPELVRTNSPASPRSDIYSLGVLAYRMLTGRAPFTAATVFELLRRACFDPVPSLRDQVPDLPPAVEELVLELLAKAPEDRPADMLAVRERILGLSRSTLGAQAVEIPASSALPLDVEASATPDSAEETVVLRGGTTRGGTVRLGSPEAGGTEVQGEPEPVDLEPVDLEPSKRIGAAPAAMVATTGPRPQSVQAPASSPSRSGETLPALGEATLRIGDSATIERPRRNATVWLAFGGVAVLAVGGAAALSSTFDGGATEAAPVRSGAVATIDSTGTATPPVAEPRDEPRDVPRDVPSLDQAGGPADASTTASTTDGSSSDSSSGSSSPPEESPARTPPPDDDPVVAKAPERATGTRKQPRKARLASETPVPPSDASVIAKLKRRIAKRCETTMKGTSVDLRFTVSPEGDVTELAAIPNNPAGACAVVQFKDVKFRPRSKPEPKKIIAN